MRAFVYFNLHKKLWSVRSMQSGFHKNRVVFHADAVHLRDCIFKVSQAGRKRVLLSGQKNVHAGVVGDLMGASIVSHSRILSDWQNEALAYREFQPALVHRAMADEHALPATYNPFKWPHFVFLKDGVAHLLEDADESFLLVESPSDEADLTDFKTTLLVKGINRSG